MMFIEHGAIRIRKQVFSLECLANCNAKKLILAVRTHLKRILNFMFFISRAANYLIIIETSFFSMPFSNTQCRHNHFSDQRACGNHGLHFYGCASAFGFHFAIAASILCFKYLLLTIHRCCMDLFNFVGDFIHNGCCFNNEISHAVRRTNQKYDHI